MGSWLEGCLYASSYLASLFLHCIKRQKLNTKNGAISGSHCLDSYHPYQLQVFPSAISFSKFHLSPHPQKTTDAIMGTNATNYTAITVMHKKHFLNWPYLVETEAKTSAVKVSIFDHEHATVEPVFAKIHSKRYFDEQYSLAYCHKFIKLFRK